MFGRHRFATRKETESVYRESATEGLFNAMGSFNMGDHFCCWSLAEPPIDFASRITPRKVAGGPPRLIWARYLELPDTARVMAMAPYSTVRFGQGGMLLRPLRRLKSIRARRLLAYLRSTPPYVQIKSPRVKTSPMVSARAVCVSTSAIEIISLHIRALP